MRFKIYQPSKNAMQSGKKNQKKWILEPIEDENIRFRNNLTGWISAKNTSSQLNFEFRKKEDAIAFAKEKNFEFNVINPQKPTLKSKSYAANFTK
jgi:hypothetical protein